MTLVVDAPCHVTYRRYTWRADAPLDCCVRVDIRIDRYALMWPRRAMMANVPINLQERSAAFQRCIQDRDVTAAEDILDDDYALVLVHPVPVVIPKAQWIATLPDYIVHRYDVLDTITAVDGDCATILHRANQHATVLGADRSGLFVITDVWRLRGDRWRIWRRHSTPLEAGEMPQR